MKKIIFLIIFFFLIPNFALAANLVKPEVKIFDSTGNFIQSFLVLSDSYRGTVDLALADLGGDGKKEIVVASGNGNKPVVEIWRSEGSKISEFMAYSENFKGGVFVTAGDLDGDKKDEIITGAGYRGTAHVRAFKNNGAFVNFTALDPKLNNGVKVAVVNFGTDDKSEIVAASNLNQAAEIVAYDNGGRKLALAKKIDYAIMGGINVAPANFDQDKMQEMVVAPGYGNKPELTILDHDLGVIKKFQVYDDKFRGGINVATADLNADGISEIICGASFGGTAHVRIFGFDGKLMSEFYAYDQNYEGGVKVAAGDVLGDSKIEIVTIPERIYDNLNNKWYKYIEVSLTDQTLTYWQDGRKLDTFLISSGLKRSPTPKGTFSIYKKRPSVNMSWYYGAGSPLNYNLPNVPWVASFKGPYTIHGTYWHKNFGHPMSHGCINMYTPQAKIIYDWVDIGTPIVIK